MEGMLPTTRTTLRTHNWFQTFAPSGSHTYDSQTTFVLPIGNNFMYMGGTSSLQTNVFLAEANYYVSDRWFSGNLMRSSYMWQPLTISGTTASMPNNYLNWVVDVNTGSMTAGPSENQPEAESASLSGSAVVASCSGSCCLQ